MEVNTSNDNFNLRDTFHIHLFMLISYDINYREGNYDQINYESLVKRVLNISLVFPPNVIFSNSFEVPLQYFTDVKTFMAFQFLKIIIW
jgi:hypothetical protein